jgi:hypothetical protein
MRKIHSIIEYTTIYLKFIVEIIKKNDESCIVIHIYTTMSMRIVLIYKDIII